MSTNVFANGSEIACKSGDGKVIAAFPDLCLSPPSPPAGPLPVPYPDTSQSKDMQSGSTTVQIQGAEVMLKDQSFYKSSPLGNEAATNTFGGGVVSGCITGETYFAAWSMDVKFEGENVDRHLDMTTSNHSSANPGNEAVPIPNTSSQTTSDSPPDKVLEGKVTEVTWGGGVKVAYGKKEVETPNWQEGLAVEDGGDEEIDGTKGGTLSGSKRPGVYYIRSKGRATTATVKIEITENVNVSGPATLLGVLGSLVMEGSCPSTSAGPHTVTVTIRQLPDSIQWFRGDVGWGLYVPDLGASIALANQPRLEVFIIPDTPASYYSDGTWTEALRFLCAKVGLMGMKTPKIVAAAVAAYCHGSRHGLKYDTNEGMYFYAEHEKGGAFKLLAYIKAKIETCNCYDQAGAVQSLCGAVGVNLQWYYLEPFGFIKKTKLVGVPGDCNNPFFSGNNSPPYVDINDRRRTGFGNHAFCALGKIVDACAGPHMASENIVQYLAASIDRETTLYELSSNRSFYGKSGGRASDIVGSSGVSSVD